MNWQRMSLAIPYLSGTRLPLFFFGVCMQLKQTRQIKDLIKSAEKIQSVRPDLREFKLNFKQFRAMKESIIDKKLAEQITTKINLGQYSFILGTN